MINVGIELMFRAQPRTIREKKHNFCVDDWPVFESVELECPQIILDVFNGSKTRVLYRIYIKSSLLEAHNRDENGNRSAWSFRIKNWYLAYEANVGEFPRPSNCRACCLARMTC